MIPETQAAALAILEPRWGQTILGHDVQAANRETYIRRAPIRLPERLVLVPVDLKRLCDPATFCSRAVAELNAA